MPWSHTSPMDQKTQFLADVLRGTVSMSEICAQYGISRKTGYKWLRRYRATGPPGLVDRSRRPQGCPQQTPAAVSAALLAARRRHPSWGAKKLLALMRRQDPKGPWPGRSTVCDLLQRHGLVRAPRARRRLGHPGKPTTVARAPNELWCADFKGEFRTGDGQYCYPLTVTDAYSRYVLACQALPSTGTTGARAVFRRVFRAFGLPAGIRTDNGVPFATPTLARLSRLSAWWVRLGILPDLIEPGRPDQNASHERFHRTLKAETTRPAAATGRAQQRRFTRFCTEYNEERPHEALAFATPASLYRPSPRAWPRRLPPLAYPAHFETRYVSANGGIRWNRRWVNVSVTCIGEYVGLEEVDDGIWTVYFGPLKLGRLLEQHLRIEDAHGRLRRHRVLPMSPD